MKKLLIFPNPMKPHAMELAGRLVPLLLEREFQPIFSREMAERVGYPQYGRASEALWDDLDLVVVLGGDGTMLSAARQVYPREIPLLGVNLGHLGFLTRVESHRLEEALDLLRAGRYQFEDRTMLEAVALRDGRQLDRLVALNELVVNRNAFATMIKLETWIDGEYFTTYPADGLIVATATGSTAYSLSAGGPIVDPRARALLVTPICPHSLYARPVVLSEMAEIRVRLAPGQADGTLTADGHNGLTVKACDEIRIGKANRCTRLLRYQDQGLFETLRMRLKEGRI